MKNNYKLMSDVELKEMLEIKYDEYNMCAGLVARSLIKSEIDVIKSILRERGIQLCNGL